MNPRPIRKIILDFKDGVSLDEAQFMVTKIQETVGANVTEGGYEITGVEDDGQTHKYSKNSMQFTFGQRLDLERCHHKIPLDQPCINELCNQAKHLKHQRSKLIFPGH